MNSQSSISTLSTLEESFFRYFSLKEFNDPEYDPRETPPKRIFDKSLRLTKAGLTYSLTLANWLGKQLSDFKDNFVLGGNRSEYVTRKASELHQILDQVEDVRTRLKTSTLPLIQHILNNELSVRGMERLVRGGHSLTSFSEHCALEVLDYINEFDPRGTANDYYNFVKSKISSLLRRTELPIDIAKDKLESPSTWKEFKECCFIKQDHNYKQKYLRPLLSSLSRAQLRVITLRYGIDGESPIELDDVALSLSKEKSEIMRIEQIALIILGLQVERNYFTRHLTPIQIEVIDRRLGLSRRFKMRNTCIANELSILPYKVRRIQHEAIDILKDHL